MKYRREDCGPWGAGNMRRGLREAFNIIMLDPEIAKVFPNMQAVNKALRGLPELLKTNACPPPRAIPAPAQATQS